MSEGAPAPVRRAVVLAPAAEAAQCVVGMPALERLLRCARRSGIERTLVVPAGDAQGLRDRLSGDPRLGEVTWLPAAGDERVRALAGWFVGDGPVLLLDAAAWFSQDAMAEMTHAEVNGTPIVFAAAAEGGGDVGTALLPAADGQRLAGSLAEPGRAAAVLADLTPAGRSERRALTAPWRSLRGEGGAAAAEKILLRSLIKDSDGYMARHFDRHLSTALSRRLVATPLTPNAITAIATLVGIAGACAFAQGPHAWVVLGGFLFVVSTILDGCDGEVARLRMVESKAGFYVDAICDNVVYLSVFLGITLGLGRLHPGANFFVPLGILVAGLGVNALVVWIGILRRESKEMPPVIRVFERLGNGDFSYIVLAFALTGHMDWFLWSCAIGTHLFYLGLSAALVVEARGRKPGTGAGS